MNKITKYLSLLLIILSSLFVDCKKRLFDYRNKYVGTWQFTYSKTSCTYSSNPPCSTQNGEYTGKVYYNKNDKDRVFIDFADGYKVAYKVDKNGNFIACGVTGKFDGENNLAFIENGSSGCTLALGSSYSYTVSGTKKK